VTTARLMERSSGCADLQVMKVLAVAAGPPVSVIYGFWVGVTATYFALLAVYVPGA